MNLQTLGLLNWPQDNISESQWQQLSVLISQLEADQQLWLSGYLAAQANKQQIASSASDTLQITKPANQKKLTILYGSQTGNGENIAKQLNAMASNAGLLTEVASLADFTVKQLTKTNLLTLVISTHGEGEAPDDAEIFYEQLFGKKAPLLESLQYSVLALGDSSYELFCHTGKEIDQRLEELGATKIHDRVDCDVDFEQTADRWINELLPIIKEGLKNQDSDNITALPVINNHHNLINKNEPYLAEILAIQKITGRGSVKNTYHIELAVDPSVIQYQPGDSIGIIANNNNEIVTGLLDYWQLSGTENLMFKNSTSPIKKLLTEKIEITQISKPFIQFMNKHIKNETLNELAQSHDRFTSYCADHQLIDLLKEFDPNQLIQIEDSLDHLRAITPRLYSIASAQSVHDDEIHLTINLEQPTQRGFHGLASGLLCQTAEIGDEISIYVEPNTHFKLPTKKSAPIILIGPGTGVAPFRAFIQERKAQLAQGENWLLFGNPNFATDFLYQTEWLKLKDQGVLTDIDVAFSRDQKNKIYIQDKLRDKANQLWKWLQKGAFIYVCGDANQMAKDVEKTLIEIISQHGERDIDAAKSYLKELKRTQRYQKDVY